MSKATKPTGMEHFSRLNSAVLLREAPAATSGKSSSDPNLIIISGWMNASLRNLGKYTADYEKLFPAARIVVITTTSIDFAFSSRATNLKRISPVLEILYSLTPESNVLLHSFSNGGALTLLLITKTYRANVGKQIPATAMVLDSMPGKATYKASVNAMAVGLPRNMLLRLLGILFFGMFIAMYKIYCWVRRQRDLIDQIRVELNDERFFGVDIPRLYLYSTVDPMVNWMFVEEHVEEAKKLGYAVSKEKFIDSGHCMHLLGDKERYWKAIVRVWTDISHSTTA